MINITVRGNYALYAPEYPDFNEVVLHNKLFASSQRFSR